MEIRNLPASSPSDETLGDMAAPLVPPPPLFPPAPRKVGLKKSLPFLLFLPLLLAGWLLARPALPAWNIPRSNAVTFSCPYLSFKIFKAVLDPWQDGTPPPERTLFRLPDPAPNRARKTLRS